MQYNGIRWNDSPGGARAPRVWKSYKYADFIQVTKLTFWKVKRWQEKPRRAWKIWFLVSNLSLMTPNLWKKDTSKQMAAGFVQHFLNVASAYLLSEEGADACAW